MTYQLNGLDFNQVCFIQQSIKGRIEYYEDKLVQKPKDPTYTNAVKDLNKLLDKVTTLKSSQGEKTKVNFEFVGKDQVWH